jgi:hypothetical protein
MRNCKQKAYELDNIEARNAAHPKTFWIPDRVDRENLVAGDSAKLVFLDTKIAGLGERMWVEVDGRADDGGYVGRLNNEPVYMRLHVDDMVRFGPEHVLEITH